MSDPRDTPDPDCVITGRDAIVIVPLADLCRSPDGPRDRQLLFGAPVTILNDEDAWFLVRSQQDGYCGYLRGTATGPAEPATHRITSRTTHAYSAPDIKSPDLTCLSFGARLRATSETATFVETRWGFVPRQHLHRADVMASDPAAVAALFDGTPYLWGGNSGNGIDCSGLIQAACLACGIHCPGDSDQQERDLGETLPPDAGLRRNDLLFWKGHVALVTGDDTLIHANAGHMAVVFEGITDAIARIERQGDGQVTSRKRLPSLPPA
ncbi:C40 family peptidase [Roseobacter ponti]|uniref:C40 family peptidase n=1 Tax=Roseobacter ponti TaxID=1891787 RepID=A0A858SQ82_9RHOB|nr:C40 family peptidase [Roseobacter ponti]QJF49853.1 C40 family peptidase [Roseobacter ponti]